VKQEEAQNNYSSMKNINLVYLNRYGTLFNCDCFDLLNSLESNTVDIVFTDPPFNLGKDYDTSKFNDRKDPEKYEEWCHNWLDELIRVLRPGGTLTIYQWPKWFIELGSWLSKKKKLQYRSLIAVKMKSGFPIRGRLHPSNYGILYYVKKGEKPTFNVVRYKSPVCRHCGKLIRDYGGYRKKFKKYEDESGIPWIQISDFWEDTRPARQDKSRKSRINELPVHIPERIILMASNPGDVVLDIFGGGGSTFHAAQMHERFWIGCEIGKTSTSATLSRFATIWGREEVEQPAKEITRCFKSGHLEFYLKHKREKNSLSIRNVEVLDNGKNIFNKKVNSKSKVLGY
jgi:site-specific DNA-methyltransferase (adenine-specific)